MLERELASERQWRQRLQSKLQETEEAFTSAQREVTPRSFEFGPGITASRLRAACEEVIALKRAADEAEKRRLIREEKLQDAIFEARTKLVWSKGATKEAIAQRDRARHEGQATRRELMALSKQHMHTLRELERETAAKVEAQEAGTRARNEISSLRPSPQHRSLTKRESARRRKRRT